MIFMRTSQLPRRRKLLLHSMAALLLLAMTQCNTFSLTGSVFPGAPLRYTAPVGCVDTGAALVVGDLMQDPLTVILFVPVDVVTLRFLWDHDRIPLNGLINMILNVLTIIPGYYHVDYGTVVLRLYERALCNESPECQERQRKKAEKKERKEKEDRAEKSSAH